MMYGLVLVGTRCRAIGKYAKQLPKNVTPVDEIPDGDINQYDFIDGKFVLNAEYAAEIEAARKASEDAENKPTLEAQMEELRSEVKALKTNAEKAKGV